MGKAFMWAVILGIISALFGTNGNGPVAIVFGTLSVLGLLLTFFLMVEDI